MRRINIVIDPELDDRLERECVERGLPAEPFDNGLRLVAEELLPLFEDVESVDDIDEYLYGPLVPDA
jgi:hypothetical protein